MGSILVVMPKREDSGRIADIIRRSSSIMEEVMVCDTGSEVLRRIEDMDISLVVTTRRLRDMGYEELYEYLPSHVSMMLLSKNIETDIFSSNILFLQLPFKPADLTESIHMLLPAGYRRKKPEKKASRSADDRLVIDKAKALLMDRNNMTEPEAYRYLQKISMDTGRTMTETAHMLLSF